MQRISNGSREPVSGTAIHQGQSRLPVPVEDGQPGKTCRHIRRQGVLAIRRLELVQGRTQGSPGLVRASLKVREESPEMITPRAGLRACQAARAGN